LYRGLVASLFGVPHVIVQFNLYENLKLLAAKKYNKSVDNLPIHVIFMNSVLAKSKKYKYLLIILVCASFCTYPHEVIRNNLQNYRNYVEKKMSMMKLIKEIYHERGIQGFYAGFRINLVRILPNTAIMFMAYEHLSKIMTEKYYKL
jgi:solute carrier family 25 folate transporter 32